MTGSETRRLAARAALAVFALLVGLWLAAPGAGAVTLSPGDIVVVDRSAFDGLGGVIRVDPDTGAQTTVSTGGSSADAFAIAVEADGDILVAASFGSSGGVIRVDPVTGAQTTVSTGGSLVDPFGIAVVPTALPSSMDQCMRGGWQSFGVFKNQGECVSFVATQGPGAA